MDKAKWFKKGQDSVKRKNDSGCVCIIDDNEGCDVVSVCGAHQGWVDNLIKDERKRIVEMLRSWGWENNHEMFGAMKDIIDGCADRIEQEGSK